MEERLAARADLPFRPIETGQLRGRAPWAAARSLWRMRSGLQRSLQLMQSFSPDVVLVTGGYVCAPVVVAARRRGRPVLIYLPDLTPGLAVRWLSRLAQQVAVTCPEAARFFGSKAVVTGYPVRPALLEAAGNRAAARLGFELDERERTLLVFGGSRGARSINQALIAVGAGANDGTQGISEVAPFSSCGTGERFVDVVAPGRSVVSLRNPGSFADEFYPEARVADRFFLGSGTSQAAAKSDRALIAQRMSSFIQVLLLWYGCLSYLTTKNAV